MKVALIDMGSKMENRALMVLSAWHKKRGDKTQLIKGKLGLWAYEKFDRFYASCVFDKDKPYAEYLASRGVIVGGYGYSGVKLPPEIDHCMPDYELYGRDRSIGHVTIGCNNTCGWCIAPRMEGRIKYHAPISEFHHPPHKKVILLDNNILQDEKAFQEAIEYLVSNKLKVCFTQGLDIRLINEKNAGMLADCKYYSLRFNERRLYFSFDDPVIKPAVVQGVHCLEDQGVPPDHCMVYFLCGYPNTYENGYDFTLDWQRFKLLVELGVDPYVMKYNGRRDIRILNHFSRWVIKRDYKRKRPKYLRPHEWQELQEAISQAEGN